VCVSSAFNSEFMEHASTAAMPAYLPVDGHDVHAALTEIDRRLNALYSDRLGDKALMGYSMGALHSLFVAATEPWHTVLALTPDDALTFEGERRRRLVGMAAAPAQTGFGAELVLAADAFVITPVGRIADIARARAEGDEVGTVIAGYHWFTDWGRDTMISLEGLTLSTGRALEARWILRTFAHYVRDGLIPNMFPEGRSQGLYHTADATLWFFHALHRYVEHTKTRMTLELVLPILKDIVRHHLAIEVTRNSPINKQPNTQVRYLPKEFNSPMVIWIFGDNVANILWDDEIVYLTQNRKIADDYRKYFQLLWKGAKK